MAARAREALPMTARQARARTWSAWPLTAFPLLVSSALIGHVLTQPALPSAGTPDDAASARIAAATSAAEPGFRREALEMFPGDPWSQGDHFAARERSLVQALAAQENVRTGAVFDAIDRDIKQGRPGARERGRVAPCMPRPFYE
jgi:hypothetical protein